MLNELLLNIYKVFIDSSFYILLGFLLAGIVYLKFSDFKIQRYLGDNRFSSVLRGSFAGLFLTLCSCAVVPIFASMRKKGASKSSSVSFLISTPETGLDSVLVTYFLIDPLMAIARPLTALFTAILAGTLELYLGDDEKERPVLQTVSDDEDENDGRGSKVAKFYNFVFKELFDDLAFWIMAGMILAGVIRYFVPEDFISDNDPGKFMTILITILVSLPFYICAVASTPLAAVMISKGLSYGNALIFMLVGAGTNFATVMIAWKILGGKSTLLYLVSIISGAVVSGLLVDELYKFVDTSQITTVGEVDQILPYELALVSAILLIFFSFLSFYRYIMKKVSL